MRMRTSKFCAALLFSFVLVVASGNTADAQQVAADAINFNNPAFSIETFTFGGGGLDFDSPVGSGVLTIGPNSPAGLMSLNSGGVGIGFDGLNETPTFPLHVVGGGAFGADTFPVARLFLDQRGTVAGFQDMLTMVNAGGGMRISMNDMSTGGGSFAIDNFSGSLSLVDFPAVGGASAPFRIDTGTTNNLAIAANGVGIGTFAPVSRLHIQAEGTIADSSTITSEVLTSASVRARTAMELRNNGPVIMTFEDSSQGTGGSKWFFSNNNDELQFRKGGMGNGNPAFRLLPTGEFVFVFQSNASFRILPNGDIQPRGQLLASSDRDMKENITAVDVQTVLDKLAAIPITTWNYIDDEEKKSHIGPMAQDFHAAFEFGTDDKTIGYMDKDGVALAAIQALNENVKAKEEEISGLNQTLQLQGDLIAQQQQALADLSERLEQMEATIVAAQQE